MEKQIFVTKLNGDHKLNKDYVRGRISGIAFVICEQKERNASFAWARSNKDYTYKFTVQCTIDQYVEFIDLIESLYPGLCIPDYKAMLKI